MYKIVNVSKKFKTDSNVVVAVDKVNIEVEKNDIFGIIGASGAGKSTLIRCLNALEIPDSGEVYFKGVDLLTLSKKEIRETRKNIGVIFQHFNLLNSKSVFDNIAFPLRGKPKDYIDKKVKDLLDLVNLSDKIDAYPNQLSGGQKQRVAIARALANDPDVLLCDEATSALDPQSTQSILELLKDLNQKLDLTIVLITHEMNVIKSICNKVAVMSDGSVVEVNDVVSLFTNPSSELSRKFVSDTYNLESVKELILENENDSSYTYELVYGKDSSDKAIITSLIRDYSLDVNIIAGSVEVVSEHSIGRLVVRICGENENIEKAKVFLTAEGVIVNEF